MDPFEPQDRTRPRLLVVALLLAGLAMVVVSLPGRAAGPAVVSLDAKTTFQTMTGWEGTAWIGQDSPNFASWEDEVIGRAVDELGLDRVRLEAVCGIENDRDYFDLISSLSEAEYNCYANSTVNDDGNPESINPAGFHFSRLDKAVEHIVLPMKRLLESRGESLTLNLCYVAFTSAASKPVCPAGLRYDHREPAEYAEFALAVSLHLREKYGLTPDSWELLLEPDNGTGWSARQMGEAIVAAGARLRANGFGTTFVAPSTTSMANAASYIDQIASVPGAIEYVSELSYHRYQGVSGANLLAIASRAKRYGLRTAMLEHIGSGYEDLHADLKDGMNSSWSQYTIAGAAPGDPGGRYYLIRDADTSVPTVSMASRTRYLMQYFRFIRKGAVRIGAASSDSAFDPLGFVDRAGGHVVVVKADRGGAISVKGLPPGTYATSYTTENELDVRRAGGTLAAGQALETDIPGKGVLTVFRHEGPVRRVTRPGHGVPVRRSNRPTTGGPAGPE